jgi:hypothetical protein
MSAPVIMPGRAQSAATWPGSKVWPGDTELKRR